MECSLQESWDCKLRYPVIGVWVATGGSKYSMLGCRVNHGFQNGVSVLPTRYNSYCCYSVFWSVSFPSIRIFCFRSLWCMKDRSIIVILVALTSERQLIVSCKFFASALAEWRNEKECDMRTRIKLEIRMPSPTHF